MQPIHIFRPGEFTPMGGAAVSLTARDLADIAAAYRLDRHAAPLVIGHPQDDGPGHGRVLALSATREGLFAHPGDVAPAFAAAVGEGRFKKVSASFFRPTAPGNPTPGRFYLKHVGFLGAARPAVPGLQPISFAGGDAYAPPLTVAEREARLAERARALDLREAEVDAKRLAMGEPVPGLEPFMGMTLPPALIVIHRRALALRAAQPGLTYQQAIRLAEDHANAA